VSLHTVQQRKITLSAGLILIALTMAAGVAAYLVMRYQSEHLLARSLELTLEGRSRMFEREVRQHVANARVVATRPMIVEPVARLAARPDDATTIKTLQAAAKSFLPTGFDALAILDAKGRSLVALGQFDPSPALSVPLNLPDYTRLEWVNGPEIVTKTEIEDRGRPVGSLVAVRRSQELRDLMTDYRGLGATGELAVCGALGPEAMQCFPMRHLPMAYPSMPRTVDGIPLPMSHALAGRAGFLITQDYRKQVVAAAYGPIGDLGLGMVLKIDTAELYAPLQERLRLVIPILLVVVALGVLLLRWQVMPVVRQLVWSERRAHEISAHLVDSEARIRAVLNSVDQGILTTNARGLLETYNPAAERIFGYPPKEVLGKSINLLLPNSFQDGRGASPGDSRHFGEQPAVGAGREVNGLHRDGSALPLEISISRVQLEDQTLFITAVRDIAERKAAEQRMLHVASHDTLTGLANRTLLEDRIRLAIARSARSGDYVGVLFIDLDHFKTINDSLGHHVGDRLLQTVAQRIRACLRNDDTVARQGGDEFIVVLPGVQRFEDIGMVAGKIIHSVSAPYSIEGYELHTSASVGVSVFPEDGEDAEALMRNSDIAMYYAKSVGRGNFQFFAPEMNRVAAERLQLETNLRQALGRDEFRLQYQPIVSMGSGKIHGVEALLRWHPESGPIGPDRFIPVAEDTGLIVPVGEWVLRTACGQFRAWHDQGVALSRVVVNVSVRQFAQKNLVAMIGRILQEMELDPEHLGLEITESLLMENPVEAIRALTALSNMGIQLSIDDFGTGYSSLSYLKRFPIDKIKIDRSFVRDIASDPEDAAIVTAIIAMAHSLDATVVAEGVETDEQLRFLRERGCDEYQGYYFSRPVPAEDLHRLAAVSGSAHSQSRS
jgi:diguanylate cyclase (GGDEF)-like protein/PAS domain S-box-containing protein